MNDELIYDTAERICWALDLDALETIIDIITDEIRG